MSIALSGRVDRLTERVEALERQLADISAHVIAISQQLQALSIMPPASKRPAPRVEVSRGS